MDSQFLKIMKGISIMKPEYLELAQTYKPGKHRVGGFFVSEKLDGTRAFWDGGISRGLPSAMVPYANTIKDGRYVDEPIATGLWSRSGKVINAPDWWLDQLPPLLLDGELWAGYNNFQFLRRTIAGLSPSEDWEKVNYKVFDTPPAKTVFAPREVKIRNEYSFFVKPEALKWAKNRCVTSVADNWTFELRYIKLNRYQELRVPQLLVPTFKTDEFISMLLDKVLEKGGEGLIFKWRSALYHTYRSHDLLKYKPINTEDGVVIGYTSGVEGKTGQLLGKIGALILDFKGKRLKLSGLTHEQREIDPKDIFEYACANPGKELPETYNHHLYPKGTIIEFKYRELSDEGVPKEARFLRIKE